MLDFSKVIDRRGTDSYKWDGSDRELGNTECIQMGCADMDFDTAPELVDALRAVVEHKVYGYATLSPEFAHGVVSWYRTRHNVELKPEWVMHSPRIVISASVVVRTLSQAGDKVILHTPYYPPLDCATQSQGRVAVEPPLVQREDGRFAIDFEQLESLVDDTTKLMIFVSPHNPTTRVWTRAELEQLAAFCVKHNLYLFVDEIHCDFTAPGHEFISMLDIKGPIQDRLIVVNSAAKSFNIMGCAISYLIIPNDELRHTIEQAFVQAGEEDTNIFGNALMKVAYQKCGYYVEEVNQVINANDEFMREQLPTVFPKAKIIPREGSYLMWIDLRDEFSSEKEMQDFLINKAHIFWLEGSHFGPHFDGYARVNIGCPRATLEEMMRRLRAAKQA